jgi:hypothetical protein
MFEVTSDDPDVLKGINCYGCYDMTDNYLRSGIVPNKPSLCAFCKSKEAESKRFETGQIYRHFKGGLYQIMGLVIDTDTNKKKVLYREFDENNPNDVTPMYVRDVNVFYSKIDVNHPENHMSQFNRFEWVRR